MTLFIRPIMNSSVEEIFAFKTCCGLRVFDQNLEIQGLLPIEWAKSVIEYAENPLGTRGS
jgi:hypothetical protein